MTYFDFTLKAYLIYRGWPKNVATHKKWVTWFIMAINEENVNKSYVFVLA